MARNSEQLAVISDIHGNLEALQTVLADIAEQEVEKVYCLGDVVGSGPNPVECLELVEKHCDVTLFGVYDQAFLGTPKYRQGWGHVIGLAAVDWSRDQVQAHLNGQHLLQFTQSFVQSHVEGRHLFVHGSPRAPTMEYVYPEDVYNQRKMDAIFEPMRQYCFAGRTHIPGVFTADWKYFSPPECDNLYQLTDEKALIAVGSVGQPQDDDPRACYVIIRGNEVEFRRLEYPVETVANKIYAIPELDRLLGDRLFQGR